MIPNNQTEGNQTPPTGGSEQPTSTPSGAAGQPFPDDVTALKSQIANLTKLVNGIQKGTDKQIGQVRGDIKRILELKEQGLNESQIQRELMLDQILTSQGQSTPVQPSAGSERTGTGFDVGSIDSALELPTNDARVTDLKLKYGSDPAAYLREGLKLKGQLSTTTPTPAEMPLPQGGAPTGKLSDADAEAKLAKMQDLSKNYSQNRREIKALQDELRTAGVIQ
jgi:hypothetical protein